MAADFQEPQTRKRRRMESTNNRQRLPINTKVEVRSEEDGFLGSWHSGTVIECKNSIRHVKYDNLLRDDGLDVLIDPVEVSSLVNEDGRIKWPPDAYRGIIRPLPPPLDIGKGTLRYGLCVDMFHQDAWWEGVVFDNEDGSDKRRVFFPDMGDVEVAGVETLRITQEWDECRDEWKPRGSWLFLEFIKEFQKECLLFVSVRQIWYEVRAKSGFHRLKDWTFSGKSIWRKLVLEVLADNFHLTVKHIFDELNLTGDLVEGGRSWLELSELCADAIMKPDAYYSSSLAIVPSETASQLVDDRMLLKDLRGTVSDSVDGIFQQLDSNNEIVLMVMPSHDEALEESPLAMSKPEGTSGASSRDKEGFLGTRSCFRTGKSKSKKLKSRNQSDQWLPAGSDIVPGAAFCPEAITEVINACLVKRQAPHSLLLKARQHLSYLGWTMESIWDARGTVRVRYLSPDGAKCYLSLIQVCRDMESESGVLSPVHQNDRNGSTVSSDGALSCGQIEENARRRKTLDLPPPSVATGPEYCPEAVVDYSLEGPNDKEERRLPDLASKAKKHLVAMGWSFHYHRKMNRKREMRYTSPRGKVFYSLKTACNWCIDHGELCICDPRTSRQMEDAEVKEVSCEELTTGSPSQTLLLQKPDQLDKGKVHSSRKPGRKRKHVTPDGSSRLKKRGKKSRRLGKVGDDLDADYSTQVLRSTKRARQVGGASSTNRIPRTVLSLLIENDVVLPRAKVQYRRKDGKAMAEGRISPHGIKCDCCQETFTLTNFEAHAGCTYHRPSENIFLEDGRSLRDCQMQMKREDNTKRSQTEPRETKGSQCYSTNDYICTVCHYGGELVLCDQCPSSFHTSCLGLEEVPAGDWYCPSCCCGMCGKRASKRNSEDLTDDSVLNCGQCEHQYHVGCLKAKGLMELHNYPDGDWFCSKKCQQIFLGLHGLIAKPVPVGVDNLTWTLLKCQRADRCSIDAPDDEFSPESYSKLHVALSVMHECFEPVKEPRTGRDLVEDVIFCRGSELNRLNFQGFYTVLLERNDELISVATVRVYGEKVAEIPLIGTRFQYRRLGMCRVLMKELEKVLVELGVQRLVLPAVPSALDTWTSSFGFSLMKESERLNFIDCTFLDFQGTVLCQKQLIRSPSFQSSPSTGTICTSTNIEEIGQKLTGWNNFKALNAEIQRKPQKSAPKNDTFELDGSSTVSEVFQADRIEENEIMDQGSAGVAKGTCNNCSNLRPPVLSTKQPARHDCFTSGNDSLQESSAEGANHVEGTNHKLAEKNSTFSSQPLLPRSESTLDCSACQDDIPQECQSEAAELEEKENSAEGLFKCYKRRKVSVC